MNWASLADSVMKTCVSVFDAENVVYIPFDGNPFEIKAIFNDPYIEADALGGAPFSTRLYRLGMRKLELDRRPSNKDRVQIGDAQFTIHDAQPDGEAGYVLLMHKVNV